MYKTNIQKSIAFLYNNKTAEKEEAKKTISCNNVKNNKILMIKFNEGSERSME